MNWREKMIEWEKDGLVLSKKSPPTKLWGFVYRINYTNGKSYIGKKQFWSVTTQPILKNNVPRPNSQRVQKRVNLTKAELKARTKAQVKLGVKTKLFEFEEVTKETKWREYIGSSKDTKDFTVASKEILEVCYDKINLTYCEVKWMIKLDVLIDEKFVNSNILGKFFVGKITKGK